MLKVDDYSFSQLQPMGSIPRTPVVLHWSPCLLLVTYYGSRLLRKRCCEPVTHLWWKRRKCLIVVGRREQQVPDKFDKAFRSNNHGEYYRWNSARVAVVSVIGTGNAIKSWRRISPNGA